MKVAEIIYNTELFRRYNLYLIKEYKVYLSTIQPGNLYHKQVEGFVVRLEELLEDNTYSSTDPNYITKVLNVVEWEKELIHNSNRLIIVYKYNGIKPIKTIELFSRIIKLEKLNSL
jgi:hypothetical protein